MIRFDNEEEAKAYIRSWVVEMPPEDVYSTIVDVFMDLYGLVETSVVLDEEKQWSPDTTENVAGSMLTNLELESLLHFIRKGVKAEPGSRAEDDAEGESLCPKGDPACDARGDGDHSKCEGGE